MTSLIDVIFLLLLFFMLTSTFSKFSEVELAAAGPGSAEPSDAKPLFLQLGTETLRLNGDDLGLDALASSALGHAKEGTVLLVSLGADVNAQRLTDLLVALRGFPALQVSVLGG
ncbi:MAG: biopolymer transporter ExbD [Sulfitobacter sp.]|nr:biopolymer transporter ExbD [Sulfitobacter sp.]